MYYMNKGCYSRLVLSYICENQNEFLSFDKAVKSIERSVLNMNDILNENTFGFELEAEEQEQAMMWWGLIVMCD